MPYQIINNKVLMAYPNFKRYASFLLDNNLDEVTRLNIERARAVDIPLLKLFASLSEQELFQMSRKSIHEFLQNIIDDTIIEKTKASMEQWKQNKLIVPKDKIDGKDMVLSPHIRKYALLKLLSSFTKDIDEFTAISLEIEEFYTETYQLSFQAYLDIQQEYIQQERDLLEAVIDNTEEGITGYDNNAKVTVWNKAVEQRTGVLKKDILGKSMFEFFPTYESTDEGKVIRRVLAGEKVKFFDKPLQRGGFYEASFIPLVRNDKTIGGITISRDITERKKITDRIEESLHFIEHITETSPDIIFVYNRAENKIVYSNKEINNIIRSENMLPEYQEAYKCFYEEMKSAADGEVRDFEYRVKGPNGIWKWILSKNSVFRRNEEGTPYEIIGIARDITKRKESELEVQNKNQELASALEELTAALEELRSTEEHLIKLNDELELKVQERTKELSASEEKLKQMLEESTALNLKMAESENLLSSIIDQTPVSTWISDTEGTQIRVNQACLDLFGVKDASIGLYKYNLFKDPFLQNSPYYDDVKRVYTEGIVTEFTMDYDVRKVEYLGSPTGRQITITTTIFPIKDLNGKVINAVVKHQDITKQRVAQEALRKSEAQLRLITDALPVLISYVDSEQRYQFNNKTYEEWFEIKREDIYGKSILELVGEKAYTIMKSLIERALSGEHIYIETMLDYKNVGKRHVSVNYIPHRNNGKVLGYYALITDISDRKRSDDNLQTALSETYSKNQELIRKNEFLDNFVFMAAHDLKSPVLNLKQLVEIVGEETDVERKNEFLKLIDASVNRLDYTINGLVEVIEVQSSQNITIKLLDLEEILEIVLAENEEKLKDINANVSVNLESKTITFIDAYMQSILKNVIGNAIKYKSDDRNLQIEISSRKENDRVILTIKDNGMGMDLEKYGRNIFKPFTRFTNKSYGKGIGLHLVKNMIEKNGGTIEIISHIDHGTTFTLNLKEYELSEKKGDLY